MLNDSEHHHKKNIDLIKVRTGIKGFDEIAHGGLPLNKTTLVSGTAGSGKTVFSMQFLIHGIVDEDEGGVFITFEETPEDIMQNMASFGWDIKTYLKHKKLAFVNAAPNTEGSIEVGDFDLTAFIMRVKHAIEKVDAKRVVIDSIAALFPRYSDQALIRRELHNIIAQLKKMQVTIVFTTEKSEERKNQAGRFGIEEFLTDNVIFLHNLLDVNTSKRHRFVEILKFRGTTHETQMTPFIIRKHGIDVFPRPKARHAEHKSSMKKTSLGEKNLDKMTFGGVYKDSITLVTGASGVGKTVLALSYIAAGYQLKEGGFYVSFEESEEQLLRNARSFGWDLEQAIEAKELYFLASSPEKHTIGEHLKVIEDFIVKHNVQRFVLDSLSSLEHIYPIQEFQEFVAGLTSFLKQRNITTIIINTTKSLLDQQFPLKIGQHDISPQFGFKTTCGLGVS